jgi:YVTN family beta-propeller protein
VTLEKTLIWRVILLGAFALGTLAVNTRSAAAQTPSPALLITVNGKGEHGLQIIDPLTAKVVSSVPIVGGSYAHEVAVSDDGKLAFVTNTAYGDKSPRENPEGIQGDFISVIDLAARKELRRLEIGPDSLPHGIRFAGGKVYFTAEGYQLVGRYDPASNRIDRELGVAQGRTHMLIITKDASKIFTANSISDSVDAILTRDPAAVTQPGRLDPPPSWSATVIPVGKYPEGIAMSPDEKEVWALTRHDGGVSIIDVATKKASQTLNLKTKDPIRLAFTPDGKRVLIADRDSGELLVLDAVTRKEIKRIMNVGSGLHCVLIAPDGSRAYVSGGHAETNKGSDKVAVIDLKTLELKGHIVIGEDSDGMAWAETR